MRMTIDEAIHTMEYYDECHIITQRQARAKAVGVMQKYQQIEGIIKVHDAVMMPEDRLYIDRIRKVLEDGNVD